MIPSIQKRNGEIVQFDPQKIYNAIFKANIRIADERLSTDELTDLLVEIIRSLDQSRIPTVEQIQDVVEEKIK